MADEKKICSSEAFPCAHGPGWSCSKCVARPVEAPPVFKSARFEGINTRCDACGYSLGLHTVAIGRAGAGCPALGVAPRTNEARHEKATTEAADVGGDRSVAQEGSEGRGCARPSHPQRLPPDAAATTNADRVAPNAEHYKQLWDDSCQAVAELCAIAGAKAGDMPDLWTLKILIEDQKSDLERLAVQAKRVARAWEDDPTSTATENAIRELGIRTPCVDNPRDKELAEANELKAEAYAIVQRFCRAAGGDGTISEHISKVDAQRRWLGKLFGMARELRRAYREPDRDQVAAALFRALEECEAGKICPETPQPENNEEKR